MKSRLAIKWLLIAVSMFIVSCDKGKKPYEDAEVLLNKSDYSGAKAKAIEVVQNAPKSKYLTQAKTLYLKVENIEGLFNAAAEALQAGDYKKVINDYEGILALDSKSPKAIERLAFTKDTYKQHLLQVGNSQSKKGNYEAALEAYKEILSFESNAADALNAISIVENTLSELKKLGDEAMVEFGAMLNARTAHNVSSEDWDLTAQRVETARVRYSEKAKSMYKFPNGKKYLKARLQAYMAEVGDALNKFITASEAAQKASNYEKKVLAVDEYNRALTNFTERYGRPEVWLRDVGIAGFKKMKVDGWMPN